jgi:hypothetical protein
VISKKEFRKWELITLQVLYPTSINLRVVDIRGIFSTIEEIVTIVEDDWLLRPTRRNRRIRVITMLLRAQDLSLSYNPGKVPKCFSYEFKEIIEEKRNNPHWYQQCCGAR